MGPVVPPTAGVHVCMVLSGHWAPGASWAWRSLCPQLPRLGCPGLPQESDPISEIARSAVDAVTGCLAFLVGRLSDAALSLLPSHVKRKAVGAGGSEGAAGRAG